MPIVNLGRSILLGAVVWLVLFCGYVAMYERLAHRQDESRMREHVAVVSDALWKLDPSAADEYLILATRLGSYASLTITDESGQVFMRIPGPELNQVEQLFDSLGMVPVHMLTEPITRQGRTIGHLVAEHRHDTIFVHLNVFLVTGLTFLAYWLFLRILAAKRNLTTEVANRTAELVEANADLMREKGFSDDVIEGLPGIFCMLDAEGTVIRWNLAALSVTGYPANEFARLSPSDFFEGQDHETISLVPGVPGALEKSQLEVELVTRDGERIPYYLTIVEIELDARPLAMCLGIDATERKRAEEAEASLRDELHQVQKMEAVGQLAGGVAHDFNNLLTAILGNAELLAEGLAPDSEESSFAADIRGAAIRAAELTKQLLGFSRKGKMQTTVVDVHPIVTEVVALLERSIDKRIEVVQRLEASPTTVFGDPTQLQSALLNLAVNGRDAMPEGGTLMLTTRNVDLDEVFCKESIEDLTPGAFIEITVADTGVGMDAEVQQRIFEPFYTTKKQGKGTGLGLASVYGCVMDHKGAISLYSESGQGSAFKVLIPVTTEAQAPQPDRAPIDPISIQGDGHILVVDDEETVRRITTNVLAHLGYSVSCCCDGVEAVEFFQRRHEEIDLVILDLIMPNMGGEEAFHLLKEIDPAARVLISSGFTRSGVADELLEHGAVGFLNKPYYGIKDLAREISSHMPTQS